MTRIQTRSTAFVFAALFAAATPAMAAQAGSSRARQASAQAPSAPAERSQADDENARETRERLVSLLRQHPPSLGEVLRLDPSLLVNDAYLTPYPALAAFLKQHPEVAHNPGYFIGEVRFNQNDNATFRKITLLEDMAAGFAVLTGFVSFILVAGWIARSILAHRRWLRSSKVQTDVHTKLLDRFTSNDELLAYIQTPVGRRFLESAPIPMDAGPQPFSAPVGRILWSIQAGLVIGVGGLGLLYVSRHLNTQFGELADIAQVPFVVGMLAVAIGVGFVLSAGVSYILSHRLGLFERSGAAPHA
jgi:hypothetical protein